MTIPPSAPEIEELIAELRDGYRINMGGETIAHSPPTRRDLKAADLLASLNEENEALKALLAEVSPVISRVSSLGAQRGPQWVQLSLACVKVRSALTASKEKKI